MIICPFRYLSKLSLIVDDYSNFYILQLMIPNYKMGVCLAKLPKNESINLYASTYNQSSQIIQEPPKKLSLTDVYILQKVIGRGGSAVVRRGIRIDNPLIQVAIKSITKSNLKNKLEELKNEVEILSKIDHPNIVKLYDYFDEEYFFHIVTEFCSGGELFDRMKKKGKLTESEVMRHMKDMMSAVSHIHKLGICHRDLKPQNFVFENDRVDAALKLIDFGIAHKFQYKRGANLNIGTFAGTIHYVAPEVIEGPYDLKCDIWSLGIIMDLMLTGSHPFNGTCAPEICDNILTKIYYHDTHSYGHISELGCDFLRRLLQKDPSDRLSAEEGLSHSWMRQVIEEPADLDVIRDLQKFKPPSQMWSAAMGILVKYLTADELRTLRATFNEMDTQGTGLLSLSDIQMALKKSGIVLPKRELLRIFKRLDFAGDGNIHYSEFLAATVSSRIQVDDIMMWAIFNIFDIDKSGEITLENLKIAFNNMGLVYSDGKIMKVIKEVDLSKSGGISFEEFKTLMQQKAIL